MVQYLYEITALSHSTRLCQMWIEIHQSKAPVSNQSTSSLAQPIVLQSSTVYLHVFILSSESVPQYAMHECVNADIVCFYNVSVKLLVKCYKQGQVIQLL